MSGWRANERCHSQTVCGTFVSVGLRAEPRERDEQRFDELIATHGRRLAAFLAQLVGDRALAEDLLQDTLLAAYRSRSDLHDVDNAVAWLYAIARNRALDAGRRRRRQLAARARLRQSLPAHEPDPSEAAAVRDLLERYLEREELALLILRHLHGFDSRELAEVFGTSPDAIRQRLSRMRRRLAAAVAAPPPDAEAARPRGPLLQQFAGPDTGHDDERLARLLAPLGTLEGPPIEPAAARIRARRSVRRLWSRLRPRR